jgi:two-component system phosphate regulon sensor histidine kinase PhoR
MIHKISNEVNNMSRLINDILMLSSLESKTVETEMLPLKMKSIVLEVLESYEIDIDKHDLHVHIHFDEIDYIGNHQQMYTLLNNIIGNAIKYNKDGGNVDIDMVRAQDDIKIIVKDTGIGIPKADQTRIFERFYRVDKGRSRQLGGTGLGLAIVKHIVSLYNGTIHLTSELDIGTTIVIVLPMQRMN